MICYTVRTTSIKQSIKSPNTCKPVLNNKFQAEFGLKWKLLGKCRKSPETQHIRSVYVVTTCVLSHSASHLQQTQHPLTHTQTPAHTHTKETKLIIRSGKTFPQTALCRNFGVSWEQNVDAGCAGRGDCFPLICVVPALTPDQVTPRVVKVRECVCVCDGHLGPHAIWHLPTVQFVYK